MRARLHPAWHLLWALPIAAGLAWILALGTGLVMCGISGCSGGGFGPSTDLRPFVVVLLPASGAVLGAPFYFVPWTRRRGVRLAVAATVGVGWAFILFLMIAEFL